MSYDKNKELLRKAGLNTSEITMFQKLLTAQNTVPLKDIITELGMTEFTGYRTARRLAERGFVRLEKQGRIKHIKALPLTNIAKSVGKEGRKLRRLELSLNELAQKYNSKENTEKSAVEIHEGREKYLDYYDTLPDRCSYQLKAFGSLGSVWQVTEMDYFSQYEKQWVKRRLLKGIKAHLIDTEHSIFHELMKTAKQELRDMRLIPNISEADQWTALTDNKAYIFENNPLAPRVLEVSDLKLVRILTNYHRLLWETANKPS